MSNPKISVTIPVYNTSRYLKQCIDSLKNQDFEEIEFIIVDDGSTDDSLKLCKEYTQNDNRFHIIHQENGGSALARQTGLDHARGEYVIVCDSDDWVEPNMYRRLYEKAKEENADIVICGFYSEYGEKGAKCNFHTFKNCNGIVDNYEIILRGAGWSWAKLIRRSLFKENGIHYEPGINLSEDSLILYKLMKYNPKVIQLSQPLYHYRREYGGTSYTNSLSMKHIYQLDFTYQWLKNNYSDAKWISLITQRAVDLAFACLRVSDLDKSFFKNFLSKELPFKLILFRPSLKGLMVLSAKLLPTSAAKYIVRRLYRLVYS